MEAKEFTGNRVKLKIIMKVLKHRKEPHQEAVFVDFTR